MPGLNLSRIRSSKEEVDDQTEEELQARREEAAKINEKLVEQRSQTLEPAAAVAPSATGYRPAGK